MMRLLLVEDDQNKARQIRSFLQENYSAWEIEESHSFQSGLKKALLDKPDILLLDMTMPTYDLIGKETGGIERRYAGVEILRRLQRRKINILVVIVTQFERFGEGSDLVTLEELRENLAKDYPAVYRGAVFYQAANAEWKKELGEVLMQIKSELKIGVRK